MKVKVFAINKYKSDKIKQGLKRYAENPAEWALISNNREVRGCQIIGTHFATKEKWTAYIDEKYVRR